jgi:Tfp pilus assembly protein PilX
MNNRGAILVFSLLVVLVLSVLLASFYFGSISENQLAMRYADSTRALWLAEAGIAKIKSSVGTFSASDYNFDGNPLHNYNAVATQIGVTAYYDVVSTGTVTSPGGRSVSRVVNATMKLISPSSANFQYGVETTSNDLDYKAKCIVNTENPTNIAKTGSTQTFDNLFGISKAEMKAISQALGTYLTGSFGETINANGVTWVDVAPSGDTLNIQHLNGSGIVVINGNFKVNGVPTDGFNGILYIIGQLETLGNSAVNGTVFVESSAAIGADLTGSSLISYNSTNISNALLSIATKSIVSWREG